MILQKMTIARRRDIDRRGKDVTGAMRTGARKPWASKQRRSVNARVKIASVWAKRVNTREKKCRNDARERLGFAGAHAQGQFFPSTGIGALTASTAPSRSSSAAPLSSLGTGRPCL